MLKAVWPKGAFNIPNLVIKTFPPYLEIFKANFRVDLQLEYGDKPFKLQIFENTLFTLENLPETGAAFELLTNLKVMEMKSFVDKIDSRIHIFQGLRILDISPPNWWKTSKEFWGSFLLLPNLQRLAFHRLMVVEGDPTELSKHPKLEFLLVDCDLHNWEDLAKILAIPQLTIFSVDPPFCKMFEAKPESVLYFPSKNMEGSKLQHLFLRQLPAADIAFENLFSAPNLGSVHIEPSGQFYASGIEYTMRDIASQNLEVEIYKGFEGVDGVTYDALQEYGFKPTKIPNGMISESEEEEEEDLISRKWSLRKGNSQFPESFEDIHKIECHVYQSHFCASKIAFTKQYVNWNNLESACKEYVDFVGRPQED